MDRLPEKLQRLLEPCPITGCWLFTGKRESRNGYGRVYWLGEELQLHRVVYTLLVGDIPPFLILDHKCPYGPIRACSNPDHLEPVTDRENTYRGKAVLFKPIRKLIV